jgi:hypothetical protein
MRGATKRSEKMHPRLPRFRPKREKERGEEMQKREKDDEEMGERVSPRDVSSIFTCLVSGLIVSQFLRSGDLVAA